MALPAGITTADLTIGPLSDFGGEAYEMKVEWQAVLDGKAYAGNVLAIVWEETAQALASFVETQSTDDGVLTIPLPHVDQEGFVDGKGDHVSDWTYRVKITARSADRKTLTKTKFVQPLVGQDAIDFELVPDGKVVVPVVSPRATVTSINGETGAVTVPTAGDVTEALEAAQDAKETADAAAPQTALDALAGDVAEKADASAVATSLTGKADLVGGKVATSQIPAISLVEPHAVANRAAMLALAGIQQGDVATITSGADKGTYMLDATGDPTVFAHWVLLNSPTDVVQTVNGQQGTVVLGKSDVGLPLADNTADNTKPVSIPQAAADAAVLASAAQFKAWAKNPDLLVAGAVTYTNNLLSSAVVEWPDGKPGVLTITSRQAGTDAVTSYTVTHVDGATTLTYTQPTITRDSSGAATLVPQITVA